MGILPTVEAVVAAFQLKEVQLLRAAIQAADQQSKSSSMLPGPVPSPQPREVIHLTPRYAPREVIHPTPRYEPRQVIHPTPRYEQRALACPCDGPREVIVSKPPNELPIEPPWKKLPWQFPPAPAPKVKLARYHPDTPAKGVLLDFFI
jgi:hypothetical protein